MPAKTQIQGSQAVDADFALQPELDALQGLHNTLRSDFDNHSHEGQFVGLFGSCFQESTNLNTTSTTGTSYIERSSIVTPSIPAGKYLLKWAFIWSAGSGLPGVGTALSLDGNSNIINGTESVEDNMSVSGRFQVVSGFVYVTLTAATHTIKFWFKSAVSNRQVNINKSVISIWRVT